MSGLEDIQVENILERNYILFFQNANISINIQVFKMLLPLFIPNDFDNVEERLLQGLLSIVHGALDDNLIVAWENFVFFEDHWAVPRAVVDGEVNDPLMRNRVWDVLKKALEVSLRL